MEFVLIHGAFHGAWCWERFIPELQDRGHTALAVDLPVSDPDAGSAEYASTVLDAMTALGEEPIVVGHSMGGVAVPLVAASRPISRMVFLAAFLPEPGASLADQRAREPIDSNIEIPNPEFTDLGDSVFTVGANTAVEMFYNDVPADISDWAVERLRPQAYKFMYEMTPLETWPAYESSYIVCAGDHAVSPDWGRQAARERLNVEPYEIEGGHSPFLSRPEQLADVLDAIARSAY